MKILIVHNDYGRYSGEEDVVDRTAAMFGRLGHQVAFYRQTTAGRRDTLVDKLCACFSGLYSPGGVKAMGDALLHHRPDVVNVHNLFPFISPAALFECRKAGIPVVMTVHNYRLVCPTGLFIRDGIPCEHCLLTGNEWGCVRFNCERSAPKSLAYALRSAVARWSGAYTKCVDRFACLTAFQRDRLIQAGFDASKMVVIPNSIDVMPPPAPCAGHYVAYLGRLSHEKGYDLLLQVARRLPHVQFRFAGDVREDACIQPLPNVQLTGYLSGDALLQFIRESRFIVMPSRCYEGFPMTVLEAAQQLKPVIAPGHGGFVEIVGHGDDAIGRLFKPNSIDSLEQQVLDLWGQPRLCEALGRVAFQHLQQNYSADRVAQQWQALLSSICC